METDELFHNLVYNQYMPFLAYASKKLSFKTVFKGLKVDMVHRSFVESNVFSDRPECWPMYCCCLCGIEHETLAYIGDTGEIDANIYGRIKECIKNGKCPHVDNVSEDCVGKAEIFAIHIAWGVGALEVLSDPRNQLPVVSSLLMLDPYQIAVLKGNYKIATRPFMGKFTYKQDYFAAQDFIVPHIHKSVDNLKWIRIDWMPVMEFCIRKNRIDVLKIYLKFCREDSINFADALQLTLENGLKEMQNILIEKIETCAGINASNLLECCETAIVYDLPEILDKFLKHFVTVMSSRHIHHAIKKMYRERCCIMHRKSCILDRKSCADIFQRRLSIPALKKMEESERLQLFLELYYKYDHLKEEVSRVKLSFTESTKLNVSAVNSFVRTLCTDSEITRFCRRYNARFFKLLLLFAADVISNDYFSPFLAYFLWEAVIIIPRVAVRQFLEFCLYYNPDNLMVYITVCDALKHDAYQYKMVRFYPELRRDCGNNCERYLIMDEQQHGWFGHDLDGDLALNFLAPLLISCGFTIPSNINELLESYKGNLNLLEVEFISNSQGMPKLLTCLCRDVLRQFYRGQMIHRYVQAVTAPQPIKDFILLKPLLKFVPKEYLKI